MDYNKESIKLHKKYRGKIETSLKVPLETKEDLSIIYTPGVAEPCREIAKDKSKVYDYTNKGNLVAIVTDGSAVLGLGNIGAFAGYPVMEGKAALFKKFGGIDAFSICLNTQNVDEIVETVKRLEPTFGGINLEDIASPRCFEIERRLIKEMNIPVFHDDQHGTAIVVLAGLINALKLTNKKFDSIRVVMNGAGAAGIAISKLLLKYTVKDIILCDSKGIIHKERDNLNWIKEEMVETTNTKSLQGDLATAIKGADVFIGVSAPGVVTKKMVRSMNDDPVIFTMANPIPEILPEEALQAGAAVVATGRSDFVNQINNVLAFPGIFRAVLDARITIITDEIKVAAAKAIASLVSDSELKPDYIIPHPFDKRVVPSIVQRIKKA